MALVFVSLIGGSLKTGRAYDYLEVVLGSCPDKDRIIPLWFLLLALSAACPQYLFSFYGL